MILPITHTVVVSAQLGDPVYNQTFGEGNDDPNGDGLNDIYTRSMPIKLPISLFVYMAALDG